MVSYFFSMHNIFLARNEANSGGRGRFSKRSASPPRPLSPEEQLAFGGVRFLLLGSACRVGTLTSSLCASTAADSALADMRLWGWHIESSQWPEVNRTPSRGQRKNIKFSRPAAICSWPLFMRRGKACAFPSASGRPDCAGHVSCCNSEYTAGSSEQARAC